MLSSVVELRRLLAGVNGLADFGFAHAACKISRHVHLDVWLHGPPKETVRDVIDVLSHLAVLVTDVEGCAVFKRNIRIRMASLTNYLDDGVPIIPPDAEEDERAMQMRMREPKNQALKEKYQSACEATNERMAKEAV